MDDIVISIKIIVVGHYVLVAVEEEIKVVVHEQRHVVVYEVGCVEITMTKQVEMIHVESPDD